MHQIRMLAIIFLSLVYSVETYACPNLAGRYVLESWMENINGKVETGPTSPTEIVIKQNGCESATYQEIGHDPVSGKPAPRPVERFSTLGKVEKLPSDDYSDPWGGRHDHWKVYYKENQMVFDYYLTTWPEIRVTYELNEVGNLKKDATIHIANGGTPSEFLEYNYPNMQYYIMRPKAVFMKEQQERVKNWQD